jgi:hypothetical protein
MMNMDLAAMYGTPGGPSEEEIEKTAQMELFVKLAAENQIDLSTYTDEEVAQLWDETFKGAQEGEGEENGEKKKKNGNGEDEEEEEKEQEKESAALAEFAAQQEWQEKVAEMDYLGRLMAHAYVNELNEIGGAMNKEAGKASELYGAAKGALSSLPGKAKGLPGKAKGLPGKARRAADIELQRMGGRASRATAGLRKRLGMKTEFMGEGKARRVGAGVYGAGAAAAGGGGGYAAYRKGKKKESSAIDEYAAELAIQKIAESQHWDVDEAVERVGALFTLGAPESEKIAMATDINEAIEARSLELLEAAGYPVEWND